MKQRKQYIGKPAIHEALTQYERRITAMERAGVEPTHKVIYVNAPPRKFAPDRVPQTPTTSTIPIVTDPQIYNLGSVGGFYSDTEEAVLPFSTSIPTGSPGRVWYAFVTTNCQYISGGLESEFTLLDSFTMPINDGTARLYGAFSNFDEIVSDIIVSNDNFDDLWAWDASLYSFWPANHSNVFPLDVRWYRDLTHEIVPDGDIRFGLMDWDVSGIGIRPASGIEFDVDLIGSPGSRSVLIPFE